jgi:hypothetical protein
MPEEHDADILSFERRWNAVSVLRCGLLIQIHLPSSAGNTREQVRRLDGYLARETSPDADRFFRLSIATDLLIDELTLSGHENVAIAIGTSIEPPRVPSSRDFQVTGDAKDFVVAGSRDGQRFALGSFTEPEAPENDPVLVGVAHDPRSVAITVDRASACVILGQRGLARPDDFDDLLRSFNAAGCVIEAPAH